MKSMIGKLEEKLKSKEGEIAELQNSASHLNFELLQRNTELESVKRRLGGESIVSMDIRATRHGDMTATKAVRGQH